MMHFRRSILIILMIVVNYMSSTPTSLPTNKGFKLCTKNIKTFFRDYEKVEAKDVDVEKIDDLFLKDSILICVKNAIMYTSVFDFPPKYAVLYYTDLKELVKSDQIRAPNVVCDEFTKDMEERNGEFLTCILHLQKFGNNQETILEKAIQEFRLCHKYEDGSYIFDENFFEGRYLKDISEHVSLRDNTELKTPGEFCMEKCPDNLEDTENTEGSQSDDEASSSYQSDDEASSSYQRNDEGTSSKSCKFL